MKEVLVQRLLPSKIDVRRHAGEEDQVDGAVAQDLVSDSITAEPGKLRRRSHRSEVPVHSVAHVRKRRGFSTPHTLHSSKEGRAALRCVEGDYAYILCTAETADDVYKVGTDTFVVRDSKIAAQS